MEGSAALIVAGGLRIQRAESAHVEHHAVAGWRLPNPNACEILLRLKDSNLGPGG